MSTSWKQLEVGPCERQTLSSGLTVVGLEDWTAPFVTVEAWVAAGSSDDPPGLAGLAHCAEHVLYRQLIANGPRLGAMPSSETFFDYSRHGLINLPYENLAEGIDLLAQVLLRPAFTRPAVDVELRIIAEEMRVIEHERPEVAIDATLFPVVFGARSRYGRPVLGRLDGLQRIRVGDLKAFHRAHLHPGNVALVGAGAVTISDLAAGAERAFQTNARRARGPVSAVSPSRQRRPRVQVVCGHQPVTRLVVALRTAPLIDPDSPAIEVLGYLIKVAWIDALAEAGGEVLGAMLSVEAKVEYLRLAGLLRLEATLAGGPDELTAALKAAMTGLEKLQRHPPSGRRVKRVAREMLEEALFDRERIWRRGYWAGLFEMVADDARLQVAYYDKLATTSASDIARVIARFLRPKHLAVVAQVPRSWPSALRQAVLRPLRATAATLPNPAALARPRASEQRWSVPPVDPVASRAPARRVPRGLRRRPSPFASVVERRLSCGAELIVVARPGAPLAAVTAVFPGGLRYEDRFSNGISNLIAKTLLGGTKALTGRTVERIVAALGGRVYARANANSLNIDGQFTVDRLVEGIELIAELAFHPSFPARVVNASRDEALAEIDERAGSEPDLLGVATAQYYRRHPYGCELAGSAEVVAGMTRDDLARTFSRLYPPGQAIIAVVGDCSLDQVARTVEPLLPDEAADFIRPSVDQEPIQERARTVHYLAEHGMTELAWVYRVPPVSTAEWPAISVLHRLFVGMDGRMNEQLRNRRGLIYFADGSLDQGADPGLLILHASLSAEPTTVEKVLRLVDSLTRDLARAGPKAGELECARQLAATEAWTDLDCSWKLASYLAQSRANGVTLDQLKRRTTAAQRVSAARVRAMAERLLDPAQRLIVLIGPERLGPLLEPWGTAEAPRRGARPIAPADEPVGADASAR